MENINSYPEIFKEALAAFEALRRFGFTSDQIFTSLEIDARNNKPAVFVTLIVGEKQFSIYIGDCNLPGEEFKTEWLKVSELHNSRASDEDLIQLWENSAIKNMFKELMIAISNKGIIIPFITKFINSKTMN